MRGHAPPLTHSDRPAPRGAHHRPWYRLKKVWLPPLILVTLFLVVFYGLDPVVEWQTRERFKLLEPAYKVTFDDASLQPTRFNYAVTGVKVTQPGGEAHPYFMVDRMELGVYGKELLNFHIVAYMELEKPRLNFIAAEKKEQQQLEPKVPDLSEKLLQMVPLMVDRIQLRQGAVLFTDKTRPDFPKIWLHHVDGTVENLATRAALARGEPTSIALSGTLQESGELSVFLTADPLAKGLFFAGRANLANFQLKELSNIMASESGLSVSEGTLDLFAEFDCRAGKLEGGIKPVLKNVKVVQGKPGIGNAVKAWLADTAVKVFSDRVGDRKAVATVIPLRGDITKPELQLWPAVIGVLRNAFVIGVSEGYARLPPLEATEKEGPVKQLIEGLDKRDAPKAQPKKGEEP